MSCGCGQSPGVGGSPKPPCASCEKHRTRVEKALEELVALARPLSRRVLPNDYLELVITTNGPTGLSTDDLRKIEGRWVLLYAITANGYVLGKSGPAQRGVPVLADANAEEYFVRVGDGLFVVSDGATNGTLVILFDSREVRA